ncbi:MAG: esterase-like activity of phytase family protein [Pseudomonadota bacterium]
MRPLSAVQARVSPAPRYEGAMYRAFRFLLLTIFLLTVDWSGRPRRDELGARADIAIKRVPLDPADSARTTVGALTFLGGLELSSRDGAFGGFSSMSVTGDRFTLLSDGGNIVRFTLDRRFRLSAPEFGDLPAGPGLGWSKIDRDSESMALDPVSGAVWVGFERANAIWRYGPGLTAPAAHVAPPAMHDWESNGGAESLVRLRDGRFLVIAETDSRGQATGARNALLFSGDPLAPRSGVVRFGYLPPDGYDPSDAVELPDGRVLVLNRRIALPFTWSAKLTLVDPRAITPGAILRGREIATLAPPLTVDNFEGLAVTREGSATILWMVSDDNLSAVQRSLLMKFRLEINGK